MVSSAKKQTKNDRLQSLDGKHVIYMLDLAFGFLYSAL